MGYIKNSWSLLIIELVFLPPFIMIHRAELLMTSLYPVFYCQPFFISTLSVNTILLQRTKINRD